MGYWENRRQARLQDTSTTPEDEPAQELSFWEKRRQARLGEDQPKDQTSAPVEIGRQLIGGLVVDLPRMAGQGLKYVGAEDVGQQIVDVAESRAPDWAPDLENRGVVSSTLIKGARAVAPIGPALAASAIPGVGFIAGPAVAGGLFGTSAAQDTYEKLREQGVSEEDAAAAARRTGLIQGPSEAIATAVGLKAAKAISPLLPFGKTTTGAVAGRLTDTRVLAPAAKGLGLNLVVQPATEVAQDVGTSLVERAYGAAPENIGEIAKESAQGAIGLTVLLGPLAVGAHVQRSKRAEQLKTALYNPEVSPEIREQARAIVAQEAKRQGVADADIDQWTANQLRLEEERNAALAEADRQRREAQGVDLTKLVDTDAEVGIGITGTINPYDIGGFVSQFQEGGETGLTDQQGLFGGTTPAATAAEVDILTPTPTPTPSAASTEAPSAIDKVFDAEERELLAVGVTNHSPSVKAIWAAGKEAGLSEEQMTELANALAQSTGSGRKVLRQAIAAKAAAPTVPQGAVNVSGTPTPITQPAGSGQPQPTVEPGSVAGAGQGAVVTGGLRGDTGGIDATAGQTAVSTTGTSQPVTPVTQIGDQNAIQTPEAIQTAQGQAALQETQVSPDEAAWAEFSDDNAPAFATLPTNVQQMWKEAVAARAQGRQINLYKVAEEISAENQPGQTTDSRRKLLQDVFGERDGEMLFDVVGMGMSQQDAAKKYGVTRSAVEKIVGSGQEAARRRQAKVQAAMGRGITAAQIRQAFSPVEQEGVADELGARSMFSEDAAMDPLSAESEGLMSMVETAGGSEANTGAKLSALETRLFALLEQREIAEDPEVIAAIESELATITAAYAALEKKKRAEVFATAGTQTSEGVDDAVQEPGAEEVDVRQRAEAGQEMGEGDTKVKAPRKGQAKTTQEVVLTTKEKYASVVSAVPGAPEFDSLTKAQQDRIADLANRDKLNLAAVNTVLSDMRFGKTAEAKNPYTAKELLAELKGFIRADIPKRKLLIVDSIGDLLTHKDPRVRAVGAAIALEGAYGVASDGRAFLVANRIEKGSGRAKFMHEVGAHLGLKNLLPTATYNKLVAQIKKWVDSDADLDEVTLAARAILRVENANTQEEAKDDELIAYFIEEAIEAGIDPTATEIKATAPLRDWFRTLWAAFKTAVRKLGFKTEDLTAQDVVNLAFGAARLEINGTWHGTAAAFRNFRNKYIGSGEGATAYGWGAYLAQRAGIAKGYWMADVTRKTMDGTKVLVNYQGWELASEVRSVFDDPLLRAGEVVNKQFADQVADIVETYGVDTLELRNPKTGETKEVYVGSVAPEGSLMRVDTAIDNGTLFAYDKPLSKQPPAVQDALYDVLEPLSAEIVELTNKDIPDLMGRDLFGSSEQNLGVLSQLIMDDALTLPQGKDAQFDKAVQQGKFHEAASHFLRVLGIDGIKFLDAKSRGSARNAVSFNGKTYDRDQIKEYIRRYRKTDLASVNKFLVLGDILRNGLDATKENLARKAQQVVDMAFNVDKESAERYGVKFDEAKAREDAKAYAKRASIEQQQLDWLLANEDSISLVERPRMNNIVVFDDANIFRVGAAPAASRQRMRFGKNTSPKTQKLINQLPPMARKPVENNIGVIQDYVRKGLDYAVFTSDLINRAVASGLKSAKTFERLLIAKGVRARSIERDAERIADMYAALPAVDKDMTAADNVNQFLFDSTRTGKWGYDSGSFVADEQMAERFDKFSAETQKFIKAVFAHGDRMLQMKKDQVMKYTVSEYDAQIKAVEDLIDSGITGSELTEAKRELTMLKNAKKTDLAKFERLFKLREGLPYSPIKRFGKYAVVAKSPAYQVAEETGDTKRLRELEQDADHYNVTFTETAAEARALASELKEQGFFGAGDNAVEWFERRVDDVDSRLFGGPAMLNAITQLRSKVAAERGGSAQLQRIVSEMYLQALAETSARKSEMKRRGVAGEIDMLRSFAQQARADAQFIASVEYGASINDALQALDKETRGGDRARKSELRNEIVKRYQQSLDIPNSSEFVNKMTRLSSVWFLATSPAYYMQNLTQPWVMSIPAMTGKHTYVKATAELLKAYTQLREVLSSGSLLKQQFDYTKVPGDVRSAIQELVNRGKIDIGMDSEMGEFRVEGKGKVAEKLNAADKGLRIAVQKVESINRLSTAMAAYRLERANGSSHEDALDYADHILTTTHGDYTAFNAPRAFNTKFGKVALQFRKFQLIQLTYYLKLLNDIVKSPEQRMAAVRMLTYSLAHTAVLAGVRGLPGFAALAWVLSFAFGDDDEDYDVESRMRKAIGDEAVANMVSRGVPTITGVDISGKVGAGNLLSIMPFSNADLTTTEGRFQAAGELIMGASGGMVARMVDGASLMMSGDWYRGLEQMLPKGFSDALKAARELDGGVTRRNGDVLVGAEEISAFDSMMQALGVPPVKKTVMYQKQQLVRQVDEKFQDRTTEIKADYVRAYNNGDRAGMAKAREEWVRLQNTKAKKGYQRRPLSDLIKAPMEQRKRERMTEGGVQFNRQNRRFVEDLE